MTPSTDLFGAPAAAPPDGGLFIFGKTANSSDGAAYSSGLTSASNGVAATKSGGLFGSPTVPAQKSKNAAACGVSGSSALVKANNGGEKDDELSIDLSKTLIASTYTGITFVLKSTDNDKNASSSKPYQHFCNDGSAEIKAIEDRLKLAKTFEKFAKTSFFEAHKQLEAADASKTLCEMAAKAEKSAQAAFFQACKEVEDAEACLKAAKQKFGLDDNGDGSKKKRSVSPLDAEANGQGKRPKA
jgi:hypothetical protein